MNNIKSILSIALATFAITASAEAQCRSTHINNETSPIQLDYGFCFAALADEQYSCNYNEDDMQTFCRTDSSSPDIMLDWFGPNAVIRNLRTGARMGELRRGTSRGTVIVWNNGDVDTCEVAMDGTVTWCE